VGNIDGGGGLGTGAEGIDTLGVLLKKAVNEVSRRRLRVLQKLPRCRMQCSPWPMFAEQKTA
jgi:hypothetical protein